MASFCKSGSEPAASVQCWRFLNQLRKH